ncbi:MAG: DNA alkylation repair protein [Bacilli bacterium]
MIKELFIEQFQLENEPMKFNNYQRKPLYGISIPNLKKFVKNLPYEKIEDLIRSNDLSCYELEIIQTALIGRIKNIDQAILLFDNFAGKAKEWSVVDSLCQEFKISRKHLNKVWELVIKYSLYDEEFYQRISGVLILSYFLVDEYIDQSIEVLSKLCNQGYYTKMAVAWAFATIFAKYPEKGQIYLEQNRLDSWTHNKTIQKAIESFRVNDDLKVKLRSLRRN